MTENKPATKLQLIALRDALLRWRDKDAAAAADNLIDILSRAAIPSEWKLHPYDFTPVPPDMPIIDMDSIEEIPF